MVLFRKSKDSFQDRDFDIEFDSDTVRFPEYLIPFFIEDPFDLRKVGTFGDRCDHVAAVVKDCKPGAQSVFRPADIAGIALVLVELLDDVRTETAVVDHTDQRRAQLDIGDILRNIAAYSAVYLYDPARIPSGRDILRQRIPFDIHKCCADHHDSVLHAEHSFSDQMITVTVYLYKVYIPRFFCFRCLHRSHGWSGICDGICVTATLSVMFLKLIQKLSADR